MRNIGPFGLENRIFAGLCGLGALLISLIIFGWGFFGSLVFGVIVAVIVLLWLIMSAGNSTASQSGTANSAVTPASAQNTTSENQAGSSTVSATSESASNVDADVAPSAAASDAVSTEETANAASPSEPTTKVKPSTTLSGEDELASRKGDWKYEAPAAEAPAPTAAVVEGVPPATGKSGAATKKTPAPADKPVADSSATPGEMPEMLAAARDGGADDLKQIKGVGPKMQAMLNEMGVYHFDQVAGWSADEVSWVDQNLKGFKGRVTRDNWVEQAATLAAGGETEFSKKVGKGGVY
jgi:predicted flap endonuclease-1-like 5' DNA nuclease